MTGTLKVTPDKLISTAGEFKNQESRINSLTQEMVSIVNGMSSIWQGDAQQNYVTKFRSLETDMTRIKQMIDEHVSDLQEMENNYKKTESSNVTAIGGLATDFISD